MLKNYNITTMFHYFFVPGSHPALTVAELSAVFSADEHGLEMVGDVACLLKTNDPLEPDTIIRSLGGTVKIGEVIARLSKPDNTAIMEKIIPCLANNGGKFKFGISVYGRVRIDAKALAMTIKNQLRENGVNSRWVTSRDDTLSSVVVEQNKLISQGLELVLIGTDAGIYIGRTLAVQPFKELSFRDYGRPARDDRSGMLPPKLAQIMINLSRANAQAVILDPFCGSGTILTEALLMGYKRLYGSDISQKAVAATKKNIAWVSEKFRISNPKFQISPVGVKNITQFIEPVSVDAVITEPYLGPQRGRFNVAKTVIELERWYSKALNTLIKILKPNGRIVMVWPVFASAGKNKYLDPDISGFRFVPPLPKPLLGQNKKFLTFRHTLIYGRSGQKVRREIVILTKSRL